MPASPEIHHVSAPWVGQMAFQAEFESGHTLILDAAAEFGGNDTGPRPKPLLLAALAACTGMDVVALLKKMRVEPTSFVVAVDGTLTDEHPRTYRRIHLTYRFAGVTPEQQPQLEKAVTLSQERYCGVSAMLRQATELTWEIVLEA